MSTVDRAMLDKVASIFYAARCLIDALEAPTHFQRRHGDVVEDCEGLSIVEQHDKEIGDLVDELKEALK